MKKYFFAIFAMAALTFGLSSCSSNDDNPASQPEQSQTAKPAALKQGIWTEYDEALLTSGKYTEEQLAAMPTVGMQIEDDKAYFFLYTADDASEPVEGKISYDKATGKGSVTFPALKDSPLSGQTVSFNATSEETLEFEFTYEGQKTTANCVWLCENLDNWSSEITDEDWKELMAYYQTIDEEAGPDASIDWSNSEVEGLAEPLVWNEGGAAQTRNKAEETPVTPGVGGGGDAIMYGIMFVADLFLPDPMEEINAKLDAVLGKLDDVLAGQQKIMKQIDQVNNRLIAIANQMKQTEAVNIFNYRNTTYYNPLKVQNTSFYNSAYTLYTNNKSNLGSVKDKLGEYAKAWVGSNEEYVRLTWQYIEYLLTVQHSTYGTGMDKIYDGLTYDKYPWEHLGTGDRQTYRAYDMAMLSKCFFMINLYAAYGGLTDTQKEGLYNAYNSYKPQLKDFCEFKATNPDKYSVCQIPGAHFVMRKQLQKYNYYGENGKSPLSYLGPLDHLSYDAAFRPEWHEAGEPKIDNPQEVKEKLIRNTEMLTIHKYYQSLYKQEKIWWTKILVDGTEMPAGAVYPSGKAPSGVKDNKPCLLMYHQQRPHETGIENFIGSRVEIYPVMMDWEGGERIDVGTYDRHSSTKYWTYYYSNHEYYAAIVEKRF